jgi:long-chain acyl-CoA synthetase
VENEELFRKIDSIRNGVASLSFVVVFDAAGIENRKDIFKFSELKNRKLSAGKIASEDPPQISKDDTATIVYTSGTTGDPKGVVLSHNNIIFNALAAIKRFHLTSEDVFLSFLPLCHMFERTCGYYTMLFAGGAIAYAENLTTIAENVKTVRPTLLTVVPAVIEKVYDRVVQNVEKSSPVKRALVQSAVKNLNKYANLKYKKQPVPFLLNVKCRFYNKIIASKFMSLAGGKLRLLVCGGAPLNKQIAKMFYIMGFNIVEGYGMTEASPAIATNSIEDNILGTVGKPFDGIEIKIGDNEEIMTRGPNVMQGYYRKPEATAKAVDKSGWLHTGDKGKFDEDGNLIITGRIKEIIVTSYGKNIAPVPVETAIMSSSYIAHAMLYGDGKKFITAVIHPERERVECYAGEQRILYSNFEELLKHEEIKKLIEDEVDRTTENFSHHEKVKNFTLISDDFTIENGMLTPTLKLRRGKIVEKYKGLINSMY